MTFQTLWAPWRMTFITSARKTRSKACIFCFLLKKGVSGESLVLSVGKRIFVLLNKFPYINGHLLILPKRHVGGFEQLRPAEHAEMGAAISRSMTVLKKAYRAQGFNVGLNLGNVAGAGIKSHVHYHVVPRWKGDSNFMPVVGSTRLIAEHVRETHRKLVKLFK